jgi:hypothetical protein
MGLIEQIARQHDIELLKKGSLELILFKDMSSILEACRIARLCVIGIEAFWLNRDSIVPNMAGIADFSELKLSEKSIVEALRFVKSVGQPDMLFEISVTTEPI